MSGIRKYRRAKPTQITRAKRPTRMSLWEILLSIGIAMAFYGVIEGSRNYKIYAVGRTEHIVNSIVGTIVVHEETPGNLGRKASAVVGFTAAGIGVLSIVFAMAGLVAGRRRERSSVRSRDILSDFGDKGHQDEDT